MYINTIISKKAASDVKTIAIAKKPIIIKRNWATENVLYVAIYSYNHIKLNIHNERSRYVEIFHVSAFLLPSIRQKGSNKS